MKHIITTIETRLQQQCNTLKYIDRNWGQLAFDEFPPLKFPCALIDIPSVTYSQGLQGMQLASGVVDVTVAFLRLHPTSATAPATYRNNTFDMMDLIDSISTALHGYGTTTMQALQRIAVRKDVANKSIEQYTISFAVAWTVSQSTTTSSVTPSLNISFDDDDETDDE